MSRKKNPEKEEIEKRIQKEIQEQQQKDFDALIKSLGAVVVIPASTLADPDVWRINLQGKTMEIRTSKLDSPAAFRQQYIKVFRKPAPAILSKNWFDFLALMGERAEDGNDEEDTETYVIEELLASISQLEPTTDRDVWITASSSHILMDDGSLCVQSHVIRELLTELNIKCDVGRIGQIMTNRHIKLPHTPKISVSGHKQRVWRFFPETINEYREKPIVFGGDESE